MYSTTEREALFTDAGLGTIKVVQPAKDQSGGPISSKPWQINITLKIRYIFIGKATCHLQNMLHIAECV
jgi:hypothetical protein